LLDFSRIDYFGPDAFGIFSLYAVEDFVDVFPRYLDDHVDPVQQRSGYFALIFFDIEDGANARLFAIFVKSAFTWIHAGDKHKISRVANRSCDSRNHDALIFQWLS